LCIARPVSWNQSLSLLFRRAGNRNCVELGEQVS
jgi:hypothetical protein